VTCRRGKKDKSAKPILKVQISVLSARPLIRGRTGFEIDSEKKARQARFNISHERNGAARADTAARYGVNDHEEG